MYNTPRVGKCFQFLVFILPENALTLCIENHAPVPDSKLQVDLFENLFPQDESCGESFDLLYQSSFRKNEDGLDY